MIYWTWTRKIPEYISEIDWFYDTLKLDLQSTQANLVDLDLFYDILDLNLKNNWTSLLDLNWFYYNQAGMLLEKYENLIQWLVKQLVIQSSLAGWISPGQAMWGVWNTKCC